MTKSPLNRQTLLRGAGQIAIGLPFLEEMAKTSILSASPKTHVPMRAFNVFFGLGIPAPVQEDGFAGALEPFKPLQKKLSILRHVNHVRCDLSGINAHFDGAIGSFTAEPPDGEAKAGGASIDQAIRSAYNPKGMPNGMMPSLVAGTFFRRSRIGRYVHSYNADGTVAGIMQEKPRDVFARVFGTFNTGDAQDEAKRRIKVSVLDTVMDQYKHFSGANSPLGATSKQRISEHLDRIREYEVRAYGMQNLQENAPEQPRPSQLPHGGRADPGGEGLDMTLDDLVAEWRLLADLYALGIKTDRVRFGSITFLAAGERLRLTGDYYYNEEHRFRFDDSKRLKSGGSKGCSHEWWHKFKEDKKNTDLKMHAHMKCREVAYFLNALDDRDAIDGNGKTILDNSLLTVSTESGDGRHANSKRELSGVFHAVSSLGGRLKTGGIIDVHAEGLDVYNTILESLNVNEFLGPKKRPRNRIDKILA